MIENIMVSTNECHGVVEYWNVEDPPLEGWNARAQAGGKRSIVTL